jgi:predicted XRE-type DNA-binding protein
MSHTKTYASVWDAIADTPEQAANLRAKAELMRKIAAIVKESKWTQTEAAALCGITQPRMNDLLQGRVSRFSLDALFNIAAALGRRITVEIVESPGRRVAGSRKSRHVFRRRDAISR